jgi:hypothetical protein
MLQLLLLLLVPPLFHGQERKVRNDITGATMDVTKNMFEVTEEKLLRCMEHVKGILRKRSPGRILE